MIPFEHVLFFSSLLFSLGLLGAIFRKNLLMILLSIEIMLNAAAFALLFVSSHLNKIDGFAMFIFVLVVAACEVVVGLGIVIRYHKKYRTLDIDAASNLKG